MRSLLLLVFFIGTCLACSTSQVFAHGSRHGGAAKSKGPDRGNAAVLAAINQHYLRDVKPIFEKKCFDCHGRQTHYPWYYTLPVAKMFIDGDIAGALRHIDMSKDFPFGGHGSVEDDLEDMQEVVSDAEMPPWRYWILHWNSRLTAADKKTILDWIVVSQKILAERSR